MSTITHPRPTPTSSRRNSHHHQTPPSPSFPSNNPPPATQQRRSRTAQLRDYYGLKPPPLPSSPSTTTVVEDEHDDNGVIPDSELDDPREEEGEFDAQAYVDRILANEDLQGVLRFEGRLVNEIRALDGEKKALVYDNYSKLIAAVETIRKMRMNMDPLGPTTSTLVPAVAHIAELAAGLAERGERERSMAQGGSEDMMMMKKKRETVRWVLNAPTRLRMMLSEGRREEAVEEWKEVVRLLDMWKGVEGVEEVRREGEQVFAGTSSR